MTARRRATAKKRPKRTPAARGAAEPAPFAFRNDREPCMFIPADVKLLDTHETKDGGLDLHFGYKVREEELKKILSIGLSQSLEDKMPDKDRCSNCWADGVEHPGAESCLRRHTMDIKSLRDRVAELSADGVRYRERLNHLETVQDPKRYFGQEQSPPFSEKLEGGVILRHDVKVPSSGEFADNLSNKPAPFYGVPTNLLRVYESLRQAECDAPIMVAQGWTTDTPPRLLDSPRFEVTWKRRKP